MNYNKKNKCIKHFMEYISKKLVDALYHFHTDFKYIFIK